MPLASTPQAAKEIDNIIAGDTVKNVKAFLSGGDQTGAPQLLEVPGRVGDAKACHIRQYLDAAFTLCQQFQ
jgi:hypothetical protein